MGPPADNGAAGGTLRPLGLTTTVRDDGNP